MVEIRYGENYEEVDLAGKTVAEVREQFKEQFGIPDKAQVRLGGKGIKKKHEAETRLNPSDKLTFAQKSMKVLFFIGAMLLAVAITGGTFAFTAISAGVQMGLAATVSDYALIIPATGAIPAASAPTGWVYNPVKTNGTLPTLDPIWKGGIGNVTEGDLFYIDNEDYTGKLSIRLSMVNHEDLVANYRFINLAVNLWFWNGTAWAQVAEVNCGVQMKNITDGTHNYWLTLRNGEVILDGLDAIEYCVTIDRGSFYTYGGGSAQKPIFSCDVAQAGL